MIRPTGNPLFFPLMKATSIPTMFRSRTRATSLLLFLMVAANLAWSVASFAQEDRVKVRFRFEGASGDTATVAGKTVPPSKQNIAPDDPNYWYEVEVGIQEEFEVKIDYDIELTENCSGGYYGYYAGGGGYPMYDEYGNYIGYYDFPGSYYYYYVPYQNCCEGGGGITFACSGIYIEDDGEWSLKSALNAPEDPNTLDPQNCPQGPNTETWQGRVTHPSDEDAPIGGCSTCSAAGPGGVDSSGGSPVMVPPGATTSQGTGTDDVDPSISAGSLAFETTYGTSATVTRAKFSFNSNPNVTSVIKTTVGGDLRQILTPTTLVDLVELSSGVIEVRTYDIPVTPQTGGNGFYIPPAGSYHARKYEAVSHTMFGYGVKITTTVDGETTVHERYGDHTATGRNTRSVDSDGLITESVEVLSNIGSNPATWTRTQTLAYRQRESDGSETFLSEDLSTYMMKGWGDEEITQHVADPNGANPITTDYVYYENAGDTATYGKLHWIDRSDGSWSRNEYDAQGRLTDRLSPWLSTVSDPANATVADSRVRKTVYSSNSYHYEEWIAGVQMSRATTTESNVSDPVDYVASVKITNRTYQGSSTTDYTESASYYKRNADNSAGELRRSISSDGSMASYSSESGDWDDNAQIFSLNTNGTATRSFTTEGTTASPDGIANKTTRSVSISDDNGTQSSETQVFTGGATYATVTTSSYLYEWELGSATGGVQGENDYARLLKVTTDGDDVSETRYTDNPDGSSTRTDTAADGSQTVAHYTADGDLDHTEQLGHGTQPTITTDSTENGNVTTTTRSAGGLSLGSSSTTGTDGSIASRTDQLGRETTYTRGVNASNERFDTETRPGGVTVTTIYYADGQIKSVTGTGVVAQHYSYAVIAGGQLETTVSTGSENSPRWRKSVRDGLGRSISNSRPGPNGNTIARTVTARHASGAPAVTTRSGGLTAELVEYDALGRAHRYGYDADGNGSLDDASTDRIEESDTYYEQNGGDWWRVSTRRSYQSDASATATDLVIGKQKLGTGRDTESIEIRADGSTITRTVILDPANKRTTATTSSNRTNLDAVSIYENGLLLSQSSLSDPATETYAYDALGRRSHVYSARTQTATATYYAGAHVDRVAQSGPDGLIVTKYGYYPNTGANAGQLNWVENADGKKTWYAYNNLGQVTHQWGLPVYPLQYSYDAYGQLNQLRTYRGGINWDGATIPGDFTTAGADLTAWTYHPASGLLTGKTDAASQGASYTYYDSGLLHTRSWARGIVTTYGYTNLGDLTSISYSDGTQSIAHTYRRDGQRLTTSDAAGLRTFAYANADGSRSGESISGGLLDAVATNSPLNALGLPTVFTATTNGGANTVANIGYGYDAVSRLSTVSAEGMTATYSYAPGSDLIGNIQLQQGAGPAVDGDRIYDSLDRLDTIAYTSGGTALTSHNYTHNLLHQRTRADLEDGGYRTYGYNDRGEVTSSQRFLPADLPLAGFQQQFNFDNIGNRLWAKQGGDESGQNLAVTNYTANNLNQYGQINYPDTFRVTGKARSAAAVTVNTQSPVRQGEHWSIEFPAGNESAPSAEAVDVVATRAGVGADGGAMTTARNGTTLVPAEVTSPTHDLDGNLLTDGLWDYTWNGENRLVQLVTSAGAVSGGATKKRFTYAYDSDGRRVAATEEVWNGTNSNWLPVDYRRFVYDGWNLVAEIDANGDRLKGYVWGTDLSGSMQDAGGVGGLLAVKDESDSSGEVYFPGYDGNGNVMALIAGSTGLEAARYEYSAFGQLLRMEGRAAQVSPFLFSTKYRDGSGLVYYGFRYYMPDTGRWASRDPIGEEGGVNIYALVNNGPLNGMDLLGLSGNGPRVTATKSTGGTIPVINVTIEVDLYWYCSPLKKSGKPLLPLSKQQDLVNKAQAKWTFDSIKRKKSQVPRTGLAKLLGNHETVYTDYVKYSVTTTFDSKYEDAGDSKGLALNRSKIFIEESKLRSWVEWSSYKAMKTMRLRQFTQSAFNHEMGHMIGHRDMYVGNGEMDIKEAKAKPVSDFWDGNLMGQNSASSVLDWRNVEEILNNFGKGFPEIDPQIQPPFERNNPQWPGFDHRNISNWPGWKSNIPYD